MKNITLVQEPGFLRDMYYVFWLNFNHEEYSKCTNKDIKNEEAQHVRNISSRFGNISEDLFIFFHEFEKKETDFIDYCYLQTFKKNFKNCYNIDTLQKELTDHNKVIKNLFLFYFHDVEIKNKDHNESFDKYVFEYIKLSNYSPEEKIKLYEFFVNPDYYIDVFQRAIVDKYIEISGYYKEQYKRIIDAFDPAAIEKICDDASKKSTDFEGSNDREGEVSFCLLDHFNLEIICDDNKYFCLLGVNYNEKNNDSEDEETVLEKFCYSLCEKSRISILSLLCERGEVSCKDLERFFDFSGSTAYHHLSIMNRMGILQTRNEGKTMFYRINKKVFNKIIIVLKKFC